MDWRPIETAPKDGTWILLGGTAIEAQDWFEPGPEGYPIRSEYGNAEVPMSIARWSEKSWRDQWDDYYGPQCPTHWQPLPEPPQ